MEKIKLSQVLLKESDKPNLNGIVYSKEALESIHQQIQENKGKIFGQLGQGDGVGMSVDMNDVVSVVEDSQLEDGKLSVDLNVLNPELPIEYLRPALRSTGTVTEGIVQNDVKIIAVDLVRKEDLEE